MHLQIVKRKAELWTMNEIFGKLANFQSLFNRTVISCPTDIISFRDCFVFNNAVRVKKNGGKKGFQPLDLNLNTRY